MSETDNPESTATQLEIEPELLTETTWTRSLSEHEQEFNERAATTTTSK